MKNEDVKVLAGYFIFLSLLLFWYVSTNNQNEPSTTYSAYQNSSDYEERIAELERELEQKETELQEEQEKVEEANSRIRDAKFYEWESYDDMGDALEELSEVY